MVKITIIITKSNCQLKDTVVSSLLVTNNLFKMRKSLMQNKTPNTWYAWVGIWLVLSVYFVHNGSSSSTPPSSIWWLELSSWTQDEDKQQEEQCKIMFQTTLNQRNVILHCFSSSSCLYILNLRPMFRIYKSPTNFKVDLELVLWQEVHSFPLSCSRLGQLTCWPMVSTQVFSYASSSTVRLFRERVRNKHWLAFALNKFMTQCSFEVCELVFGKLWCQ